MSNILVTGGNRGIGRALATFYADRGDNVWATSRVGAPQGAHAAINWQPLDVTNPASFAALSKGLEDVPLDLLICNAGVYLDKGNQIGTGYAPHDWASSFAVNVTGVFLSIEAVLPALKRSRNARIAIIGSAMGSDARAPGGSYIYRASKAAALNLGRNLATDFRDFGIAVGVYHPGWVATDMGGAGADIQVDQAITGLTAEFDALDMSRSGCFRTYDGQDHAY